MEALPIQHSNPSSATYSALLDVLEDGLHYICLQLRILPSWRDGSLRHQGKDNNIKLATLCNVSLAGKACNRAARPHLYFAVDMRNHDIGQRLRPFLRVLLQRPDTGSLVQQLYTQAWNTQAGEPREAKPLHEPASATSTMPLLAAANSSDLRSASKKRLTAGIRENRQDTELATLLCLCQNLRL